MNKLYMIAPIILVLSLTACGSLTLTDSQKETVATLDNKLEQTVTEAAQQLEESAAAISDHKDEIKEQIKEAEEVAKEAIAASSALNNASEAESPDADDTNAEASAETASTSGGILSSPSDIALTDTDGKGVNYTFIYDGETFTAVYKPDSWRIYDSYKITSEADITIICQALIDVHQVHGKDLVSFRTADDMAYEWLVHNTAYELLPDGNDLKAHAKDVDLDPKDQGRTLEEIYKDRTGKELTMDTIMEYMQQNTGE